MDRRNFLGLGALFAGKELLGQQKKGPTANQEQKKLEIEFQEIITKLTQFRMDGTEASHNVGSFSEIASYFKNKIGTDSLYTQENNGIFMLQKSEKIFSYFYVIFDTVDIFLKEKSKDLNLKFNEFIMDPNVRTKLKEQNGHAFTFRVACGFLNEEIKRSSNPTELDKLKGPVRTYMFTEGFLLKFTESVPQLSKIVGFDLNQFLQR